MNKFIVLGLFIFITFGIFIGLLNYSSKKEFRVLLYDFEKNKFYHLQLNKRDIDTILKKLENIKKNSKLVINPKKYYYYLNNLSKYCYLEIDISSNITYKLCKESSNSFLVYRVVDYKIRTSVFYLDQEAVQSFVSIFEGLIKRSTI